LNEGHLTNLAIDLSLEWSNISHGSHLIELHDMLFKLLLNVKNRATDHAWLFNILPGQNVEISLVPVSDDVLVKLFLKLLLLNGILCNFLDFFLELKNGSCQKLLEAEGL
jgi:hypothetical protein